VAASKESGQLGIAWAGVAGSSSSEGGGHARIAGSVGGSGGQISVSSGGAGARSAAGGQVDFMASAATAFGGSVNAATTGGSAVASASAGSTVASTSAGSTVSSAATGSTVASASGSAVASVSDVAGAPSSRSPGEVGTVCAHPGAGFLLSPLADDAVLDQSGS